MNVEIVNSPQADCDEFVSRQAQAKICHAFGWSQAIRRAVGLKPFYLAARQDGKVRGVLPLMQTKSRIFGNRLVSQAFANYGGILADGPEAMDALYNEAVAIAKARGCESIEFRNIQPLPYELHGRSDKVSMHLPLNAAPDVLWKGFDAKVRNQVRKAEKSNITPADGGLELLDEFYEVYTVRMRQLGTPCFSRNIMRCVLEAFPNGSRVFVVWLEGKPVGAGFTTYYNGLAEIPWASTLTEFNTLCPNNLLYWSIIKHYCLAGAKVFDFGRSTVGAGTHQFKKQWEPREIALHYQYWVRPGKEFAITGPGNPKFQRKVEMWKKLPLWTTRLLGPRISRNLP